MDPAPTLLHRLRLRAAAIVAATILAGFAVVSLAGLPAWPVVGVAVATLAVAVNKLTSRLHGAPCMGCGHDLSKVEPTAYGLPCPHCGTLNQYLPRPGSPPDEPPADEPAGPDDPARAA